MAPPSQKTYANRSQYRLLGGLLFFPAFEGFVVEVAALEVAGDDAVAGAEEVGEEEEDAEDEDDGGA